MVICKKITVCQFKRGKLWFAPTFFNQQQTKWCNTINNSCSITINYFLPFYSYYVAVAFANLLRPFNLTPTLSLHATFSIPKSITLWTVRRDSTAQEPMLPCCCKQCPPFFIKMRHVKNMYTNYSCRATFMWYLKVTKRA